MYLFSTTIEDLWDDIMDMDIMFIPVILIFIFIVSVGVCVYNGYRIIKADDRYTEHTMRGKVLDKYAEQTSVGLGIKITVENILFENSKGERMQLRNVKPQAFGILSGDQAEVSIRNRTIYGYRRINK